MITTMIGVIIVIIILVLDDFGVRCSLIALGLPCLALLVWLNHELCVLKPQVSAQLYGDCTVCDSWLGRFNQCSTKANFLGGFLGHWFSTIATVGIFFFCFKLAKRKPQFSSVLVGLYLYDMGANWHPVGWLDLVTSMDAGREGWVRVTWPTLLPSKCSVVLVQVCGLPMQHKAGKHTRHALQLASHWCSTAVLVSDSGANPLSHWHPTRPGLALVLGVSIITSWLLSLISVFIWMGCQLSRRYIRTTTTLFLLFLTVYPPWCCRLSPTSWGDTTLWRYQVT